MVLYLMLSIVAAFDIPLLSTTNFTQGELGFVAPAFLSNGFHGIRPGPIPIVADPYAGTTRPSGPYPGGVPTVSAVVAGYLHRDPKSRQQVLAASPFPFETDVVVEGVSLQQSLDQVTVLEQVFDFTNGELRTFLSYADKASEWKLLLNITQFVSRTSPTLAVMRIAGKVDPPTANVTIRPLLSQHGGVPGTPYNDTDVVPNWTWDPCATLALKSDSGSRLGVTAKGKQSNTTAEGMLIYDVVVSSVSDVYSSDKETRADGDPMLAAYVAMEAGLYIGSYAVLESRNRAAWADLWSGRLVFEGSGFTAADQRMMDTVFFYLVS
jgi:trehalose/maltose hydrolase-like predicted phosphorylase